MIGIIGGMGPIRSKRSSIVLSSVNSRLDTTFLAHRSRNVSDIVFPFQ